MSIMGVSEYRRQMLIGRAKTLFDAGKTVSEVCEALKISESTCRSYKAIIDGAEKIKI